MRPPPPDRDSDVDARLARLGAQFRALERAERLAREGRAGGLNGETRDADALAVSPEVGAHAASTGARDQEQARAGDGVMPSREVSRRARRGRYLRGRLVGTQRSAVTVVVLLFIAASVVVVSLNHAPPAGASSPVSRAPMLAERAGSVRFRSSLEITVSGATIPRYTETGGVSFASRRYESELRFGGQGLRIRRRLVGGQFFEQTVSAKSKTSSWHAFRVRASHELPTTTLIDPQVVFEVMSRSVLRPMVVGDEDVDGIATRRYRVDTSLYAFLAAERDPSSFTQSVQDVPGRLDVWLDRWGRPRRIETRFQRKTLRGVRAIRTLVSLSNYGASVNVRPPKDAGAPPRASHSVNGFLIGDPFRAFERLLFDRAANLLNR